MSVPVTAAPGLFVALKSIYAVIIAAATGTEHFAHAYGDLGEAAHAYTTGVAIEAKHENRVKVLELERKFKALEQLPQ